MLRDRRRERNILKKKIVEYEGSGNGLLCLKSRTGSCGRGGIESSGLEILSTVPNIDHQHL